MKTMLKPILLTVATLVAALFIVFCGTLYWIQSNHGLHWVQSRINALIPGKITIETHRLSLLRLGLDLNGVVLHDPQGLALAGFTHLSVKLDGWALWRRLIRLESILLKGPWAELDVDEVQGINLMTALIPPSDQKKPETATPDSTGLPFNIVFDSIQLTDGRINYTPSDKTARLEATGITLAAAGDLMDRSGSLVLELASVRFSSAGIRPEPARIALRARLDGDKLRVSTFDIISGQSTLTLSGSAESLTTTPQIDGVLSIGSQLAELKSIFNLAGDFSGPANATLTLKGPVTNPDAKLALIVGSGLIAGQPFDGGDLSIELKNRLVTIEPASLRLADGAVVLSGTVDLREAFPVSLLTPPDDTDTIAYDLSLVQDIPDLSPWLKPFVDISGAATGQISLSGNGVIPSTVSARLTMQGSGQNLLAPGMDQPINVDVNLSAQMDHGTIVMPHLNVHADGVELSGDGRFQMDSGALAGNLSLRADNLSRVSAVVGIPSVNGACSAIMTVNGNLNRPQFSLNVASKRLTVGAYTIGNVSIIADMNADGRLDVANLSLTNQDSRLEGTGRLRLLADGGGIDPAFGNDLKLVLNNVSAADFMLAPPIDGNLSGQLKLNGPLESLSGELSLNATALKADAATIGDIYGHLRLADGTIVVDRLHLKNQDSTLTASGNVQLLVPGTLRPLDDPTFNFSAVSDPFHPEDFVDMASGDFTFKAELMGSLQDPVGQFSLAGSQAKFAGQPMGTISLEARLADQRLWIDRLTATTAPGEGIAGSGWLGLDKTVDLRLKTDSIAISRIQPLHDLFPGEGLLRASISAQGRMDNPDIDGQLSVSDIIVNEEVIDDLNLTFSLHDMQAKATGNLNFELDAACDLRRGDFDAYLLFDQTETGAYFKAAGQPGFNGILTGRVQAKGNIHDVANAWAQVDLSVLDLRFEEISLVQSDRISLQLAERKLSISDFTVALLSEGHLRLQGDASIGGRLDMAVDGRVPLAAVGFFSEDLKNATGVVGLAGDISGEMTAPQFDARIDLKNIGLGVPGLVQQLRNLSGSIHLTPDRIRIDSVEGFLGTGRLAVAGSIDLDQFEPDGIDLRINARSVPLEVPDALTVRVNSDIQIKGKNRSANASGEIILLEGVYDKDVNISLLQIASTATTRQRTVAPATRPVTIPYFDTVDLNIIIGHRQPFLVDNNLAQLAVSPDLRLGGTLANPIVSGRAQIREGTVTFQRRTFEVQRGIVDFVNPYRTEAEIDILSQTEIRTWRISLGLKGTPDNLDITLTSVPSETEADILSLILFGRTAGELTAGEGGSQRTTGQIMAEMLADTFGSDIKRSTGLDILQLETTDSADTDSDAGVRVTVGKHLSDRMTVKYDIETKDGETVQRAITEYKLLENILVSGFQDNRGIFGSELAFRIEFR